MIQLYIKSIPNNGWWEGLFDSGRGFLLNENCLPVCVDIDGDDWDETEEEEPIESASLDKDEDGNDELDTSPPLPKLHT